MFEQKNNGQNEHNLTSSSISSPEVHESKAEEILKSLKKDRRSAGKIFHSLCQEIINFSDGRVSEEEAIKSARNLIGLFETALKVPSDKRSNGLEDE
jgi:hypothetical protein